MRFFSLSLIYVGLIPLVPQRLEHTLNGHAEGLGEQNKFSQLGQPSRVTGSFLLALNAKYLAKVKASHTLSQLQASH